MLNTCVQAGSQMLSYSIKSIKLLSVAYNQSADADMYCAMLIYKNKEEQTDVLIYTLLLLDKHKLVFSQNIEETLSTNSSEYPVEKLKESLEKYTEL